MEERHSLDSINSLVFQFAVKVRQISQKKDEIQQQVKVYRTSITEKKSHIEKIRQDIKNLEEEIQLKQVAVKRNKEKAKSMKTTNNLLLQYEQTLRAELESRQKSYNHDQEAYEERIASYIETLQSCKEAYFQNPAAQKLLLLQAEIQEIESRIKDCDKRMMVKQKDLEHLNDRAVSCYSIEKLPDSVLEQQPTTEEQSEQQREDCSIDISSIDLNQAASSPKPTIEENAEEMNEENKVQDPTSYITDPEQTNEELWSHLQLDELGPPDDLHTEAEDQELSQEKQLQLPASPVQEDVPKDNLQGEAPDAEGHQGVYDFHQTSQKADLHSLSTKETSVSSTPTFAFNFSPTSSPRQGTADSKSPAFVINLNSNVSTPAFSGFGFNMGPSQEEDSSFGFSGSFFNEKKASGSKPSGSNEFLFNQPEESEDFHFAFTSKTPHSPKDNSKNEFPFSFSF